jgi:hypothetical protein
VLEVGAERHRERAELVGTLRAQPVQAKAFRLREARAADDRVTDERDHRDALTGRLSEAARPAGGFTSARGAKPADHFVEIPAHEPHDRTRSL